MLSIYDVELVVMAYRFALGRYLAAPEGESQVVYYDEDFVVIKDAFPKAVVHWLVLPRDKRVNSRHPLDVLRVDKELYDKTDRAVQLMVPRALEKLRAVVGPNCGEDMLRVGVHSVPSLAHLHVHIISKEMHSARLKNYKHYMSFNSDFFVPFAEIRELKDSDPRLPGGKYKLEGPLQCWKCGEKFGRKFAALKHHLEDEFQRLKDESS